MWDIYTQGVASLCPGLSACYPFREFTLQDYPAGQGFILVYRLAIDARTSRVDSVTGRKYPSLLEDFQTGTASMARKRHLASSARGLLRFMSYIHHMIRPIRNISQNPC